jgi:hypothetical protein
VLPVEKHRAFVKCDERFGGRLPIEAVRGVARGEQVEQWGFGEEECAQPYHTADNSLVFWQRVDERPLWEAAEQLEHCICPPVQGPPRCILQARHSEWLAFDCVLQVTLDSIMDREDRAPVIHAYNGGYLVRHAGRRHAGNFVMGICQQGEALWRRLGRPPGRPHPRVDCGGNFQRQWVARRPDR